MTGLTDQLRLALHAIWVRRWLALAVAWGVCLAGWLAVSLVPNRYESQARVLVQVQTLLSGKIGIDKADMQRAVDGVRQTLTSSENLTTVVKSTALAETVLSDADRADAVAALQKGITIEEKADGLFAISARVGFSGLSDAQNAQLAPDVVTKLVDLFQSQNAASGVGARRRPPWSSLTSSWRKSASTWTTPRASGRCSSSRTPAWSAARTR